MEKSDLKNQNAQEELNEDELDSVAGGCPELLVSPWSQPHGTDCDCDGTKGGITASGATPSEFAPPEITIPLPDFHKGSHQR